MAIRKLNNIVYSRLSNPWSSVISDRWKHDTTQDWENLAKNLDGVSAELIEDEALLRLDMHISANGYLEEGAPRFNEVTGDKEMIEDGGEAETVSDSEEENKKKRALRKEMRDARALSLIAARPYSSGSAVSVPGSAPPFASASAFTLSVPGSSALLSSALLSASDVSFPVLGSSALLSSAFPSTSGVSVTVLGLSALLLFALPSTLSISGVSVPVPRLLAPPSVFGMPVLVPKSSPPPFPTWSDPQTLMLVSGKR